MSTEKETLPLESAQEKDADIAAVNETAGTEQEADNAQEEALVTTAQESDERDIEDTEASDDDDEDGEDDEPLQFSMPFTIEAEELYQFQLDMGKEQIAKNQKRSKYVSIAEIALGIFYFGAILAGKIANGAMQYILAAALVGLGVYGFIYFKYRFYPSLRKSVLRQHSKTPYFQSEIVLDFYETKCVERACGKDTANYWRNLHGVMESAQSYYLQLDKNRCLLIPKRCAVPELEPFLREMCERFEKDWKQLA